MLNSQCNNNDKAKQKKKQKTKTNNIKQIMRATGRDPGYMDSKTTMLSTTLWNSMQIFDKIFGIC